MAIPNGSWVTTEGKWSSHASQRWGAGDTSHWMASMAVTSRQKQTPGPGCMWQALWLGPDFSPCPASLSTSSRCLVAMSCPTLLQPHGLQSSRLLCPWNFPGKDTGVGCHFLLQGIFTTQGSNPRLLGLLNRHVGFLPQHHKGPIEQLLDTWTDALWALCSWSSWTEELWASYSNLCLWFTKAPSSSYAYGELLSFPLMLKIICSNYLIDIKEHPKYSINSKFKENLGKNFQYF